MTSRQVPDFRLLPTFELVRASAFRRLGDAADELRSDFRPDRAPTARQAAAVNRALRKINEAKAELDRAVLR